MATQEPLADVLELATLLTPAWAHISAGIPDWHPRCEGDGDGDEGAGAEADEAAAAAAAAAAGTAAGQAGSEPDWKAESRKHEKRMKAEKKRADELAAQLAERDAQGKSEQEQALEQARKEARDEALTEAQKERRADRLEVSVTRLAAKGVTIGEGDDAETVRFADPEDALLIVEREIARGDLDEDEIFDREGKVQTDALTTALADLLKRKPHLRAGAAGGGGPRLSGDADAGKGKGPKAGDDLSVDEHLVAVQGR